MAIAALSLAGIAGGPAAAATTRGRAARAAAGQAAAADRDGGELQTPPTLIGSAHSKSIMREI